jgi:hypothetical protein
MTRPTKEKDRPGVAGRLKKTRCDQATYQQQPHRSAGTNSATDNNIAVDADDITQNIASNIAVASNLRDLAAARNSEPAPCFRSVNE